MAERLFLFFFLALLSNPVLSQLDDFIYRGFHGVAGNSRNNLSLNGVAEIQHNGILKLTNDTPRLIGHAFYPTPINFTNPTTGKAFSFSTTFVFAIVPEYAKLGGHGMAFAIAPTKLVTGVQPSQYLGLLNASSNGNLTDHVVAVEFDTVQDFEFFDINDNHVGIDINSLRSNATANASYFADGDSATRQTLNLKSGKRIQAWIDYDSAANELNVTLSLSSTKPRSSLLSFPVDLSPYLADSMFVGFSASTGLLASSHYVMGWSFKINGQPQPLDLSSLPSLPGPKKSHTVMIIAASASSISVMILSILIAFYIIRKIKNMDVVEAWELEMGPHRFSYKELKKSNQRLQSKMEALSIILVILFTTTHISLAFTDGLLRNGNFENAPRPSDLKGTVVLRPNAVPEWEISGFVEYIKAGQKQGDMLLVVPEGAAAIRLGNEASIKQRVNVTRGMYYSITFSAARTCAQEERVNVSVAPDFGVLPIQTVYSSSGWDSYAWAFQADFPVADILIHNPGEEEDPACGPLIDSIAIKALYPPRATNKNLLKNGGFEEGPYIFPNTTWGTLVPPNIEDDHSPIPAWMVESLKAVKYIDYEHFSVPQGRRAVELVAGKESAIAQVTRTITGKKYELSFAVGDASNSCEGSMIVEAFAGRDTIKVPYESKGKGGYKRAVLRFVATSERTRIMFFSTFYTMRSDDFASLCGPVVDDVKLVSIRSPRRLA